MSHMIESAAYSKRPAWHNLGTVFDGVMNVTQAKHLAGLEWLVLQEPIFLADGTLVPNKFALVRNTDRRILGVRSDEFTVFQNHELFSFLETLLGVSDHGLMIEAAGSLDGGKRVWVLARMPSQLILGDQIDPYFVLANGHDGSLAFTGAMTPLRVECQNMLTMALGSAKQKWSIRHTGNLQDKQHDAQKTLQLASAYMTKLEAQAEDWQQKRITQQNVDDILEMVFPLEEDATERIQKNILNMRNQWIDLRNDSPDLRKFRGTAWEVMNVFSDMATHIKPIRKTENYSEKLFASFIDGNKIMENAQAAIEKVIA